jgi:hypothetical protein
VDVRGTPLGTSGSFSQKEDIMMAFSAGKVFFFGKLSKNGCHWLTMSYHNIIEGIVPEQHARAS